MKTRKFGNIFDVSVLGFGAMRMPVSGGHVDENEAIKMIRYAIDHSVNYIDTAYFYHNGESEEIVGKALLDGYRSKTMLATKLPLMGNVKCREDFDRLLEGQLKKLRTDHIDFYLLHSVNKNTWNDVILKLNLLDKMETAKKDGKIGHIGFSFHDDHDTFIKIIDAYDKWEFCQIQYNYMDTDNQAGTSGLEYAGSKGIPVIVMEPVLGGKLANTPPSVQQIFDQYHTKRTAIEWALNFVWSRREVPMLLSGMSSMEQLKENLRYAENAQYNALTDEDMAMLARVKEAYGKLRPVPCTECKYCMPCPSGVDIPANFSIYNDTFAFGLEASKGGYMWIRGQQADLCTSCGQCESKCPQKIGISALMPKVHERLTS
ncbi:aldo/keto reductase [Spirochaetia bacterium]|nr:aldo/keto reductase [Spirochaetia bacterium]